MPKKVGRVVRGPPRVTELDPVALLLDGDGFNRTNVDARAAIAAGLSIHRGHVFLQLEGLQGARFDALATAGAGFSVNFRYH